MQFLIDNLTATIITSIIILMAMTVNLRTQQTLTETTSFHAMMKQGESFIQILRRDMQGITEPLSPFGKATSDSLVSFSFMGIIGISSVEDSIRYTPELRDMAQMKAGGDSTVMVPIYSLTRYVNGQPSGGTLDMFTAWNVQCFKGKEIVTTPDEASTCTSIEISFEAVPRLGDITAVGQMQWGATFYPPLLSED